MQAESEVSVGGDGHAGERLGFGQVGGKKGGKGQESFDERTDGFFCHERPSRCRHHDGIHNEGHRRIINQRIGNGRNGQLVVEHATLDGHGTDVVEYGTELLGDHVGRNRHDVLHAKCVLDRHCRHYATGIAAQGR